METSWVRSYHLLFLLLLVVLPATVFSATLSTSDAYPRCNGSIAECKEEEEFLMESETAARLLLQESQRYISYGAVKPNEPVCGGGASGQAYTKTDSCQPPQSNPQTRGCSKYYRCRSDS